MNIEIPVSRVFKDTKKAGTRLIVNEGSSRSTKTYSVIQYLIGLALEGYNYKVTICRAKLTWLRASVMPDFFDILENQFDMYNPSNHNRSENIYELKGTTFQFIGLDEAQKLHGRKQDVVWINEAIECDQKSFRQLLMRTTTQLLLDYNPSTDTHWIYDNVIPRDDCTFIKSTYKDNPFLEPEIVSEIERLEPTKENIANGTADETSWKIYGLGERASQKGLIFGAANIVDELPPLNECKKQMFGLDFGFTNDPTALMEIRLAHGQLYIEEKVYERGLVNRKNEANPNQPSIEKRLEENQIDKNKKIWADSAEPKSIRDLQNAGYNVQGAKKGPDSIRSGIETLKRYPINITKKSLNLIKERNNYKWLEDSAGNSTNTPIDAFNHGWDGCRYPAMMELGKPVSKPGIRNL